MADSRESGWLNARRADRRRARDTMMMVMSTRLYVQQHYGSRYFVQGLGILFMKGFIAANNA